MRHLLRFCYLRSKSCKNRQREWKMLEREHVRRLWSSCSDALKSSVRVRVEFQICGCDERSVMCGCSRVGFDCGVSLSEEFKACVLLWTLLQQTTAQLMTNHRCYESSSGPKGYKRCARFKVITFTLQSEEEVQEWDAPPVWRTFWQTTLWDVLKQATVQSRNTPLIQATTRRFLWFLHLRIS